MGQGYSMLGFVVIVILYLTVGFMAATGTIFMARKLFSPKGEQTFFAMFLIMIAAFYLAFAAYFGAATAWRLEASAVAVFAVIGLVGARLPVALMVGYLLHGLWDMVHELQSHGVHSGFEPSQLTAIPLAYGIFCLAYDLCVVGYAYTRREEWNAAWKARPSASSSSAAV